MAIIAIIISVCSLVGCFVMSYFSRKRDAFWVAQFKKITELVATPKGFGTTVGVHERTILQHDADLKELGKKIFKIEFTLKSRTRREETPEQKKVVEPLMDGWVRGNL